MRTIRRLYFYAVAFISLEVVLWGLISLARSFFAADVIGGSVTTLAQALALILVGLPVFGLHWWVAQRGAASDAEERANILRAIFLYGVLLATLIPVIQNFLAALNHLFLLAFNLSTDFALLGQHQTWSDNLIAILMNSLAAAYFIIVLRADWQVIAPKETYADIRRIYRYIWVGYGLALVIAGIQQILSFVLTMPEMIVGSSYRATFVNGLALLFVGAPLWFFAWKIAQDALAEPPERESLLRLGVLYLLALSGIVTVLTSSGVVIYTLLRLALGEAMTWPDFMNGVSGPLSIGIPLGGVWAYYSRWLGRAMSESPDAPRRAGLRRLYYYVLSLIGLGASFTGLAMLLSFVIDAAFGNLLWGDALRPRLAASLATLFASLPLWLLTWRSMQAEALAVGDSGDHARRSVVRKAHLYLVMFASVIGGMVSAVAILFNLFSALLGETPLDFGQTLLNQLQVLFLFVLLGVYHGLTLRRDGRMATHALNSRHALFPVLIFDPGDGDSFAQAILAALQKQTPRLPAAIQPLAQPIKKEALAAVKAVILPGDLALNPPEALRLWLRDFNGSRIVVPRARRDNEYVLSGAEAWIWTGGAGRSLQAAAGQAAQAIRQLAEGQEVRQQTGPSGWMIFVCVIAALFGLQILFMLFGMAASFLFD